MSENIHAATVVKQIDEDLENPADIGVHARSRYSHELLKSNLTIGA